MSVNTSSPVSSAVLAPEPSTAPMTAGRPRSSATTGQSKSAQLPASVYSIDHQVKYLHLQAETDALLQQLQMLQRSRQAQG